jgi:hypothetical protein
MKNILLPIVFISSFFCNIHAAIIEQVAVDARVPRIRTKMMRDRYGFYGLAALGIAYQIGVAYVGFKTVYDNRNASQASASTEEKTTAFGEMKKALHSLFCTQEGLIYNAQLMIGVGSAQFASALCESLIHPDTLRWYVNNQAPYNQTIKILHIHLEKLLTAHLDDQARNKEHEILQLLYNRLARQAEMMCAYVAYKTHYLEDEEKKLAEHFAITLITFHNHWLDSIKKQLSVETYDYQALKNLLDEYKNAIRLQMNYFAALEGETQQERSMVKRQIEERQES